MGFMSNFTGFSHASFAVSPAIGNPKSPATVQQDGVDKYKRVPRESLEVTYMTDAQTFNTINTYKQVLLQTGYRIVSDNKTNQTQYDKFFENIGQIGMKVKLEQLLDRVIHDTILYGYAYVEKVFAGNKIVDLKPIDAKLMDYARTQDSQIVVNSSQNPVGYTMKVGYNFKGGDAIPVGFNGAVKLNSGEIFLDAERIACFILNPIGNGFESMGLIEPAFTAIVRKSKIETAIANNIHNSAASHFVGIVGDAQQKASKQLMESTLGALQNLSYNRVGVFSYPTQIQTIDVQHSPQADEFLRYERTEQSAASGLALGFAVGSGEAVNRQTLTNQKELMDMRMDSISFTIADQFTTKILDSLYEYNGYGSKAKLIWNEVSTEDKVEKSNILLNAVNNGALVPEEAREYILKAYEIKAFDKEYNKKKKEKEEDREDMKEQQEMNSKDINVKNETRNQKKKTSKEDETEE